MKTKVFLTAMVKHFSRWCGKGYAIFAALKCQVRISFLARHICACALLKSARKGVMIRDVAYWEEQDEIKEKTRENFCWSCLWRGEVYPGEMYVLYKINKRICPALPIYPFLISVYD